MRRAEEEKKIIIICVGFVCGGNGRERALFSMTSGDKV
jgi:hypothetical protein